MRHSVLILLSVFLLLLSSPVVRADDDDDGFWFGGDMGGFDNYGMDGWGDGWYYSSPPVYTYSAPVAPPAVAASPLQSPSYWYCRNPAGYYPEVPECYGQWQAVPQQQPVATRNVAGRSGQRDRDDRRLDALAAQFYSISSKTPHALDRMKKLHQEVETFHQGLFDRKYNAMDILHDTESLEKRIERKEAAFAQGGSAG